MNDTRFATVSGGPVDPALAMSLQPELDPKERLRWARQPLPGRFAFSRSIAMVLMGLFFVVFSNLWMGIAATFGAAAGGTFGQVGQLFWMFGLPFLIIGLCLVLSPIYRFIKARRMIYAVTDRRVIILSQFPSRTVQSFERQRLGRVDKKVGGGGAGNLTFFTEIREGYDSNHTARYGFFATPDVAGAEAEVRRLIAAGT